jgi:GR25 family glycosyltransferase involved in LPS biosynthesis
MYDWSYFDKIYCISTPESVLKRNLIRKISKQLKMNIDIRIFKRHPNGSNQGCFESHISVLKDAYKNKYNRVIILEDDIIMANINSHVIEKITNFLKNNRWDLFYLGAVPDARKHNFCIKVDKQPKFYRIKSLCTHAYVMNKNCIKKFHDINYIGIPIDYLYRDDESLISYAYFPTQFFQETGFKIPQILINYYFRFLENYAYYIGIHINNPIFKVTILILIFTVLIYFNFKIKSKLNIMNL